MRLAAGAVLQRRGHQVHLARSSPAAMLLAERHRHIQVLIADVHMCYVNGLELAQRLRKHHPKVHVLLTASVRPDWIDDNTLRRERIELLHKPYTATELLHAVAEHDVTGAFRSA